MASVTLTPTRSHDDAMAAPSAPAEHATASRSAGPADSPTLVAGAGPPRRRSPLFRRLVECDRAASRFIAYRLPHPDRLTRALGAFSHCGDHGYVWYGLAAAVAAADRSRRRERFLYIAGGQVTAELLTHLVKTRIRRRRPDHHDERPDGYIRQPTTHSFPSAHASMGVLGVVTISRLHPRLAPPLTALLALLVFTRVFLRVHYAADVVAGLGFGAVLAALYSRLVPTPR